MNTGKRIVAWMLLLMLLGVGSLGIIDLGRNAVIHIRKSAYSDFVIDIVVIGLFVVPSVGALGLVIFNALRKRHPRSALFQPKFRSDLLVHYSEFDDMERIGTLDFSVIDINARWRGATALIWAVKNGNRDLTELLLKKGADPDKADKRGMEWPMQIAEKNNDITIIALLKSYGARDGHETD